MMSMNRLKELRIKNGLTQAQLAERVGTTFQNIYKLEKENRSLNVLWINRLAKALNVSPAEVAGFDAPASLSEHATPSYVATPGASVAPPTADDVPYWGRALTTTEGDLLLGDTPDAETERPPCLRGDQKAYVLIMTGEVMAPRYHEGEALFVSPKESALPGKYVALTLKKRVTGARGVVIGRLIRKDRSLIILQQYGQKQQERRFIPQDVAAVEVIVNSGKV